MKRSRVYTKENAKFYFKMRRDRFNELMKERYFNDLEYMYDYF